MILTNREKKQNDSLKTIEDSEKFRKEFLLRMYDQAWNNINTHIMSIWESIGVLLGSIGLFILSKNEVLPIEYATILMIILIGWLLGHLYDVALWYNRNLVIIANIERQFLKNQDLKDIHYFIGQHRKSNDLIENLKLQWWFGISIGVVFLVYHFFSQIYSKNIYELLKTQKSVFVPYTVLILVIIFVICFKNNREKRYKELLANSPGENVDFNGNKFDAK